MSWRRISGVVERRSPCRIMSPVEVLAMRKDPGGDIDGGDR
jgi:hypothetical protein